MPGALFVASSPRSARPITGVPPPEAPVYALLGRIVNHLPEPLLLVDGKGGVRLANDAARTLANRIGATLDLPGLLGPAAPAFLERARHNGEVLVPVPTDGGHRIHKVVGRAVGDATVVWF